MGAVTERLLAVIDETDAYSAPYADVQAMQVAALDERLAEYRDRIKLAGFRAKEAGVSTVRSFEDAVPLLLPHTAYKSYPEGFLADKRWDRMTKWLGTVTSIPLDGIVLDGVEDIDQWVERLGESGVFVSCTSGTTGNPAMLVSSQRDTDRFCRDSIVACSWGSGVQPAQDRLVFGLSPIAQVPRNIAVGDALRDAFGLPGVERFTYPVPPITIGSITRMISLRRAISNGTARPAEIAEFEKTSAERQIAVDQAVAVSADALIAARNEKLYISGMWATLYQVAQEVRKRGYSSDDFHPENTCFIAGGLKGAQLPADYREYVFETFHLKPERNYQMYSMQEIGTALPRCREGGRYHVPPWLICLPLDKDGGELMPGIGKGEVEGRAAFFDLSLEGRWGGVISGDRIRISYEKCACGNESPSIADDIVRYSDLEGDDKISCSGTVDAYVRGMA